MRSLLLAAILPAFLCAAPKLEIVKPLLSDNQGGAPNAAAFEYLPGGLLFFTCRIAGYSKSPDDKVHLAYSVQAFDAKDVPLDEIYKNDITGEAGTEDKDWLPRIETTLSLPPLVAGGTYKIVVKAEDVLAKTSTELAVPFHVRASGVEPSDTLVVRNFQFSRNQEGTEVLVKPVYRPGDVIWAKFDITGFRYGPGNRIDVSYVTTLMAPGGTVLWLQPEPALEQSESFYPKRYFSAGIGVGVKGKISPEPYTILVQVKDAVGKQAFEVKRTFTIE